MCHKLKEIISCTEYECSTPENINEELYFNIDRNNVFVLDHMMTACKDDNRVIKFSIGSHNSPKRRKGLLNQATQEELKGLCEICLNILKANIPLSYNNFRKLKRNSKTLKVLANSKILLMLKSGWLVGRVVFWAQCHPWLYFSCQKSC